MFPKKLITKSDNPFIIRKAEIKDAPRLLQYINRVGGESDFLTFGKNGVTFNIEQEEAFINSFNESENSLFLIAEINGEIGGVVSFLGGKMERINHQGELGITVARKYWGIGIGKSLMQAVIDWARYSSLITKIYLEVVENNERAIQLYENLGFHKEGVIQNKMCIKGEYVSTIAMGLFLD